MILASILLMSSADVAPVLRPINPNERNAIEDAVADQVSDPTAVRFRLPATITVDGHYCGLVDGKSIYGEYVGYTPFHVRLTHEQDNTITISEIVISTSAETAHVIEAECARRGLDLRSAHRTPGEEQELPQPSSRNDV